MELSALCCKKKPNHAFLNCDFDLCASCVPMEGAFYPTICILPNTSCTILPASEMTRQEYAPALPNKVCSIMCRDSLPPSIRSSLPADSCHGDLYGFQATLEHDGYMRCRQLDKMIQSTMSQAKADLLDDGGEKRLITPSQELGSYTKRKRDRPMRSETEMKPDEELAQWKDRSFLITGGSLWYPGQKYRWKTPANDSECYTTGLLSFMIVNFPDGPKLLCQMLKSKDSRVVLRALEAVTAPADTLRVSTLQRIVVGSSIKETLSTQREILECVMELILAGTEEVCNAAVHTIQRMAPHEDSAIFEIPQHNGIKLTSQPCLVDWQLGEKMAGALRSEDLFRRVAAQEVLRWWHVDSELVDKGPDAVDALCAAVKECEYESCHIARLVLLGDSQSGKSTLKAALYGGTMSPHQGKETEQIVDMSTIVVKTSQTQKCDSAIGSSQSVDGSLNLHNSTVEFIIWDFAWHMNSTCATQHFLSAPQSVYVICMDMSSWAQGMVDKVVGSAISWAQNIHTAVSDALVWLVGCKADTICGYPCGPMVEDAQIFCSMMLKRLESEGHGIQNWPHFIGAKLVSASHLICIFPEDNQMLSASTQGAKGSAQEATASTQHDSKPCLRADSISHLLTCLADTVLAETIFDAPVPRIFSRFLSIIYTHNEVLFRKNDMHEMWKRLTYGIYVSYKLEQALVVLKQLGCILQLTDDFDWFVLDAAWLGDVIATLIIDVDMPSAINEENGSVDHSTLKRQRLIAAFRENQRGVVSREHLNLLWEEELAYILKEEDKRSAISVLIDYLESRNIIVQFSANMFLIPAQLPVRPDTMRQAALASYLLMVSPYMPVGFADRLVPHLVQVNRSRMVSLQLSHRCVEMTWKGSERYRIEITSTTSLQISILGGASENSSHWLSLIMASLHSLLAKYKGLSMLGGQRVDGAEHTVALDFLPMIAAPTAELGNESSAAAEVMVAGQLVHSTSGTVFKILEEIGSGGFGVVYKVEVHTDSDKGSPSGEFRALKFPVTSIASAASVCAQLRHEKNVIAQLLQDCDDPNPPIIKVFDVDHVDKATGLPFVEFELGCGKFLSEIIGVHPLAGMALVKLGEKLARALAFVHQQGKTHADVKPENILLAGQHSDAKDINGLIDGASCKLIDFGLCMGSSETRSGPAGGTILYMSPKLCSCVTWTAASPADDVYAMGVTLAYAMLGRHPCAVPAGGMPSQRKAEIRKKHSTGAATQALELWCPRSGLESHARELVLCMVALDEKKRPSAAQARLSFQLMQQGIAPADYTQQVGPETPSDSAGEESMMFTSGYSGFSSAGM